MKYKDSTGSLVGFKSHLRLIKLALDMNLVIEYRNKSDLYDFDKEFSRRPENLGKEKDLSWKLALESDNQRLTQLLNEERRALYDEEIVRELATRYHF